MVTENELSATDHERGIGAGGMVVSMRREGRADIAAVAGWRICQPVSRRL